MARGNIISCSGAGCSVMAAALGAFNASVYYPAPHNSTLLWNNDTDNWDAAAYTWN